MGSYERKKSGTCAREGLFPAVTRVCLFSGAELSHSRRDLGTAIRVVVLRESFISGFELSMITIIRLQLSSYIDTSILILARALA